MIQPGDYSIVRVELEDGTDIIHTTTLAWGYDTLEEARAALQKIGAENDVQLEDLAVARLWFSHDLFGDDQ